MNFNLKKAFTLIELLIFMGVLSIILFVLSDIFTASLAAKTQSYAHTSLQQDGRFILAKLVYDINQASTITSPTIGNSDNNLIIIINGSNHQYRLNNGNLELVNDFGVNTLNSLSTEVTSLQFLHLGNPATDEKPYPKDNVRINLTLRSKITTQQGQPVINLQTTAGTR